MLNCACVPAGSIEADGGVYLAEALLAHPLAVFEAHKNNFGKRGKVKAARRAHKSSLASAQQQRHCVSSPPRHGPRQLFNMEF